MTSEFEILCFCFLGISISSLKILSFHDNTSLLLINKCIVLHIIFPEKDAEVGVRNCFTLPLPAQAVDRITDTQLCRGILFVLSSLGWICILGSKGVNMQGRRMNALKAHPLMMRLFRLVVLGTGIEVEWLDFW